MSLIDSASLIVTPNAYKEGALYSVIPSDGSGDLSVTRATTATRVNSAGLVELVPYNLVQYSEQFDNAYWGKFELNVIANSTTAPDGTLTADFFRPTTANSTHALGVSSIIGNGSIATASIYAKANGYNYIGLSDNTTGQAVFNLSNGTIVSQDSGITAATPISVGNGWYRLQITFTASTSRGLGVDVWDNATKTPYIGNGTSGIFAWGAQLVEGSVAKDYQKTETRLNIPRLDYSNGTCPSILVEPQRTNLLRWSSSIDNNSSWAKIQDNGGSTPIVTANYGISPDGTQNADRIQLTRTNATNSFSYVYQAVSSLPSGQYTWSVWLKSLSGTPSVALSFDGTNYTNIVTLSNEWARYEFTTTAAGNLQATFLLFQALPSTSLTADFLAYGFQLEAGSYATSYIPTTSASVTRNADVISKTGISSLIGQTEGTLYAEVKLVNLDSFSSYIAITSGAFTNSVMIGKEAGVTPNKLFLFIRANGSNVLYNTSVALSSDYVKCAIAYKSGNWAAYVNGNLIASGTSTFSFSSSLDRFGIGVNNGDLTGVTDKSEIKATALWKTRLTNDELERLTGVGFNTYTEMANYYNYITQ